MKLAGPVDDLGNTRREWTVVPRVAATRVSDRGYEAFVRQHFDPLAKTLAVVALDRDLGADAAQEAFLQLHLRWHEVDQLDDPVAWLYRVGINRCRDYRRRLARATRLFERLGADAATAKTGDPWLPDHEFVALLNGLPKRQRVAAVLFYQADFSTEEIARVMHISEGAVKSHLHRARETLRPLLERELERG